MVVACSACSHQFEGGGYRDETCPACGALALPARACPRCTAPLGATRVAEYVFDECGRCGGVFIASATIERLVAGSAEEVLAKLRDRADAESPSGPRRCPTCQVPMAKRMASGGSGMIFDLCRSHGVFFDAGELHTFVAAARGEVERAERERLLRAQEQRDEGLDDHDASRANSAKDDGLLLLIDAFVDLLRGDEPEPQGRSRRPRRS